MQVYFKNLQDKKLGMTQVDGVDEPADAILAVKEDLVAKGVGYDGGVLALIHGGKKE